jgi:hypothetical protein
MEKWNKLLPTQQTLLILKALVNTWSELGSDLPTKFTFENVTVTADERGFYLTAYRSSGSLYFTLSFTRINSEDIEVVVTPYRYSKPVFDELVAVALIEDWSMELLVSQLHKNYVEALSKVTPSLISDRTWSTQFGYHLENLISEFIKDSSVQAKDSRVIKDLPQEFAYMFSRLADLYERGLRSSRWVDSGSSVKDTDNSELIISENYLSFKTVFGREVGYIFQIKHMPEHKLMSFDFELSDDYGYLVKFTGHGLDFKLASYLASKIPEERKLQFLNEVEECLVSLNLWSDYFIPMEYIYR